MSASDKVEYELAMCSPQTGGFGYVIRWGYSFNEFSNNSLVRVVAKCYRFDGAEDVDAEGMLAPPYHFSKERNHIDKNPVEFNEFDDATPAVQITQKWDGCSNTDFSPSFHLCEPDQLIQFADLIKYVTTKAATLLKEQDCDMDLTEGGLTYLPPIPYQPRRHV